MTLLDPSPAMLDKARQRLRAAARRGPATGHVPAGRWRERRRGGRRPALRRRALPWRARLPRRSGAAGRPAVPVRGARRHRLDHDRQRQREAVRPALERRWDDALAAFDARTEIGVLGVPGRADTVEELSELMRRRRRRAAALVRGLAVRRLARVRRGRLDPADRRRWRRRPRSSSKPAGATRTASSAASSTSWAARVRADVGAMDADITRDQTRERARLLRVRSYDVDLDFTRGRRLRLGLADPLRLP